jgi:hypothetical protein
MSAARRILRLPAAALLGLAMRIGRETDVSYPLPMLRHPEWAYPARRRWLPTLVFRGPDQMTDASRDLCARILAVWWLMEHERTGSPLWNTVYTGYYGELERCLDSSGPNDLNTLLAMMFQQPFLTGISSSLLFGILSELHTSRSVRSTSWRLSGNGLASSTSRTRSRDPRARPSLT